jgi:protein translocase SecG subunit
MSTVLSSFPLFIAAAAPVAAKVPAPVGTSLPLPETLLNQSAALTKSPLAANAAWLTHTLAGLFVFFAIALIVLLAVQTTKQEGLSGTIGGRVEAAYRPRLGFDQQLSRMTSWIAIGFVFVGFLLSLSGI